MIRQLAVLVLPAPLRGPAAFGPLRLHPVLAARQQVTFGGRQRGAFELRLRNSGPVAVPPLSEQRADDSVLATKLLMPHQAGRLVVPANTAAVAQGRPAGRPSLKSGCPAAS